MPKAKLFTALAILFILVSGNGSAFARRVTASEQNQKKTILIPKDECVAEPASQNSLSKKSLRLGLKVSSIDARQSTTGYGFNGEISAISLNELRLPNGTVVPAGATLKGDIAPHTDNGSYYFFHEIDFGRIHFPIEASFDAKNGTVPVQRGKSVVFVKDAGPYYYVKHTPPFNEKYQRMHQGLKDFFLKVDDVVSVTIGSAE